MTSQPKRSTSQSKYPKLLSPIVCEWYSPTGLPCNCDFKDMLVFQNHVRDHGAHTEGLGKCAWNECSFSSTDTTAFSCHLLYHCYHSYLKLLGCEVLQKSGLPGCQLSNELKGVLPLVEIELRCLWNDGSCGVQFDCPGDFYAHVHDHAANEANNCCRWKGCGFIGKDKSKVLEHTRTHTKEKVVACPVCGNLFANNAKFKDHIIRQMSVDESDSSLVCSFCQKCFPSERLLREHVRRHVNIFKCPHCDLTCNTPSRLTLHIRYRHMEVKPHECPLCHKKFKTSYSLSDHIELHREKNISCIVPGCQYMSKTARGWQTHMKTVHSADQMLYCCHVCNGRFSAGVQLSAHLKSIHGFTLPPGHCRFRYVAGSDGLKRLQTVRIDDENIITPKIHLFNSSSGVITTIGDISTSLQQQLGVQQQLSVEEE